MADYLVTDTELINIANAIRTKGGTSETLTYPNGFVSAINAIETGTDISDTTAVAEDVLSGKYFYTANGTKTQGAIATKTASNLSASGKTVTVPSGYYASQYTKDVATGSATTPATTITANPVISVNTSTGLITASNSKTQSVTPTISAGYISSGTEGTITINGSNTSQLTVQAAQTITPTTTDQTIASGKYLTGTQTIKGDANLIAGNIKKDVTIFGVVGTLSASGNTDIEDALMYVSLTSYQNSRVTVLGSYALTHQQKLTTVSFPACTIIWSQAFEHCYKLTTVSFPVCSRIGSYAFYYGSVLSSLYFPSCTMIEGCAFARCSTLSTVSFPNLVNLYASAFENCYSLKSVSFPKVINLSSCVFSNCSTLSIARFSVCSKIGSLAFAKCYKLLSLYLLSTAVVTLSNSNAFSSTPIGGYTTSTNGVYGSIYVKSSLLASYKAATNWTYFSNRIVGI